jgi:hypothetical protein
MGSLHPPFISKENGTRKYIKKNLKVLKHPARKHEKKTERIEVQTKEHTQTCRMHNGEP